MSGKGHWHIGVIGAGQLGRMLALAGYPLNIRCQFLDRDPDAPAAQVAPIMVGALDDPRRIADLARASDVVTFDWENVPAASLRHARARIRRRAPVPIRPPLRALSIAQDRLLEKQLFASLAIPVAPHARIDDFADLVEAARRIGDQGILKTRRLGYDGKGQVRIRGSSDLRPAFDRLAGVPLIYERLVPFTHEVSLVAARSTSGEIRFYPLTRNTHRNGILHVSLAPQPEPALERRARIHMRRVLQALGYTGVLAIEFFVAKGRLIANEMAPRVHNSGHWTIEGCPSSQFENHLRAICGLPLGSTRPLGHCAMINFVGSLPSRDDLLAVDGLSYHDYGKQPRPGRKLGHCTILAPTAAARDRLLRQALKLARMG